MLVVGTKNVVNVFDVTTALTSIEIVGRHHVSSTKYARKHLSIYLTYEHKNWFQNIIRPSSNFLYNFSSFLQSLIVHQVGLA